MQVSIAPSWKKILQPEFNKPYFNQLVEHLKVEKLQGKTIYPPGSQIFNCFNSTSLQQIKVVILGQDPYHAKGQAHGLSFSVPNGMAIPPSLQNIFIELENDLGVKKSTHGNLLAWASQGVFLLNASLTVREGEPMSHAKIGWGTFTDEVIQKISFFKKNVVFLLWGKFAQEKIKFIDQSKHIVFACAHPSPLSAYQGFFNSHHFSKTNAYLINNKIDPINWKL